MSEAIGRRTFLLGSVALAAAAQQPLPLVEPADLAKQLNKVQVVCVTFPVLYRARHIKGAIFAGPGRDAQAVESGVASVPKTADVVIYCGCCPMEKCPNVGPAYAVLQKLGFQKVRVLNLPTNFHTDWVAKGYPSDI